MSLPSSMADFCIMSSFVAKGLLPDYFRHPTENRSSLSFDGIYVCICCCSCRELDANPLNDLLGPDTFNYNLVSSFVWFRSFWNKSGQQSKIMFMTCTRKRESFIAFSWQAYNKVRLVFVSPSLRNQNVLNVSMIISRLDLYHSNLCGGRAGGILAYELGENRPFA